MNKHSYHSYTRAQIKLLREMLKIYMHPLEHEHIVMSYRVDRAMERKNYSGKDVKWSVNTAREALSITTNLGHTHILGLHNTGIFFTLRHLPLLWYILRCKEIQKCSPNDLNSYIWKELIFVKWVGWFCWGVHNINNLKSWKIIFFFNSWRHFFEWKLKKGL